MTINLLNEEFFRHHFGGDGLLCDRCLGLGTLQAMRQTGGYDTSIQTRLILKTDGTFELVHMPDWWKNDFGESGKGFDNYSGNWIVSKFGKVWSVELKVISGTRFANLIGQSPPYRIDFIIGDADENNSMIFLRQ